MSLLYNCHFYQFESDT